LRKRYKLYFDELTSKEQREHFKKFIRKWNEKELEGKNIVGINNSVY
jgi:hypothetical protein